MASQDTLGHHDDARPSFWNNPVIRGYVVQIGVVVVLVSFISWIVLNTIENLRRAKIASGFDFLNGRAGFDISVALIPYSSDSRIADALIVGIITATIIGFLVGVGRLSGNWLIARICTVYVELFRNIPPLLVIFFWYLGVLQVLPQPRASLELPFGTYLNSRGLFMPSPIWGQGSWLMLVALLLGIAMAWFVARRARQRQMATGQRFPVLWTSLALIIGLPVLAYFAAGMPLTMEYPQKSTFNLIGGMTVKPEFLALYLALSFYTASFIAEIVRAGIKGVPRGQTEASYALGLRPGQAMRLVIIPQAMRIVIPPLTSQYLNLTKNSSLAVAVGYPDLVATGGTILNQTGQSIEIVAIWMLVYLSLSIATSIFMNWFNARVALVER